MVTTAALDLRDGGGKVETGGRSIGAGAPELTTPSMGHAWEEGRR
jgi:hypothetical protein